MNGLYLVFRENITRFFDPFDHKGPWYDYFKYLPQLFIPWTPFLVLAFAWACKEWKRLSGDERWLLVSNIVIFTVFSLSGSKRVYYILPILPFCALLTALYLCRKENGFWEQIKVILLKVYEWVFFIAGFILLAAPLIWHFVKRMLPFELPQEINTFIYAFPIPLGILFLFIFIYFRKQNPSGTKWDFCGSSSFTRAAVSCAVLMIFVFGIAIPVFDVTLRTGKPFMLEAAQKMKAAGIDRANVAFPVKTYTTLTYYLSYPQHIPVLAEEHEEKDLDKALAGFFAAAGTTPVGTPRLAAGPGSPSPQDNSGQYFHGGTPDEVGEEERPQEKIRDCRVECFRTGSRENTDFSVNPIWNIPPPAVYCTDIYF